MGGMIGSVVPGVGTLAGGAVGGTVGAGVSALEDYFGPNFMGKPSALDVSDQGANDNLDELSSVLGQNTPPPSTGATDLLKNRNPNEDENL